MVDKTGLTVIGCVFGATTAAVLLVATLLVSTAVASGQADAEAPPIVLIFPSH